jgi:hypothetical protein
MRAGRVRISQAIRTDVSGAPGHFEDTDGCHVVWQRQSPVLRLLVIEALVLAVAMMAAAVPISVGIAPSNTSLIVIGLSPNSIDAHMCW